VRAVVRKWRNLHEAGSRRDHRHLPNSAAIVR